MLYWLKRRLIPTSLMARVQVLLILPIILIIGLSALLFFVRHWHEVQTAMVHSVVREVSLLMENRHLPFDQFQAMAQKLGMRVIATDIRALEQPRHIRNRSSDRLMSEFMPRYGLADFDIDSSREDKVIDVWVAMPDGIYHLNFHQSRIASFTIRLMVGVVLLLAVLFSAIAAVFMRRQMQPIINLTKLMTDRRSFTGSLAKSLTGSGNRKAYRFSGASEVRGLTRAFLDLQRRQNASLTERTEMLRGISHDLRTPLTRMSLQLQMIGDSEENQLLQADIGLMTRMIDSYLQFSADNSREQPGLLRVADIVAGVEQRWAGYLTSATAPEMPDDHAEDKTVQGVGIKTLVMMVDSAAHEARVFMRPMMLARALDNLIDNGFRFASRVWFDVDIQAEWLMLTISDDGPGVPETSRLRMLEPFQRLDENRIAVGSGSGLGLAMVKETMLVHSGDIALDTASQGGLKVRLRLPTSI